MMTRSRWLFIAVVLLAPGPWLRAAEEPAKIQPDVVYGHKDGMALTFDVLSPAKPNGAALLYIRSGGWYSSWQDPRVMVPGCQPYLSKGYTVFIVYHGSAPKYTVPEAVEDVRRSVRFIRFKAKDFNIDPERLGAFGLSAGGHLTLMLAVGADDGDPKSKDEVLRQSSRIAAAVALFPPTDIRDWVTDPPEAIKKLAILKAPLSFDAAKAPACSPLLLVSAKTAPTLLIHGDKDELVPIDHSRKMLAALEKAGIPAKLAVVEGAGHGYNATQNQKVVLPELLKWFDKYLDPGKRRAGAMSARLPGSPGLPSPREAE